MTLAPTVLTTLRSRAALARLLTALFAFGLLLGGNTASASAAATRTCKSVEVPPPNIFEGTIVATVEVVKGRVSCSEAKRVARTFFRGDAKRCTDTLCFNNRVSGGWVGGTRMGGWTFWNKRRKAEIHGEVFFRCDDGTVQKYCEE